MTVTIVVPMRDAAATISGTLDALAAQDIEHDFQVVVVDDGSTDDSAGIARRHPLGPVVVPGPRSGAGAARNAGARATNARSLAFTDADCAPEPSWLRLGVEALSAAGLVQGAVLPPVGVPVGPWDRTLAVTRDWGLFEAANLFVRRDVFDRLGGFQEHADAGARGGGRPFGEDTDFGWRARRVGITTAFRADVLVRHAVFNGTARDVILERLRDGLFCDLVGRIPELRETFLYRRWFLSSRSAAFNAALVGIVLGVLRRRKLVLATLASPYAALLRVEVQRRGGRAPARVATALVTADAVGWCSLIRASLLTRSFVL